MFQPFRPPRLSEGALVLLFGVAGCTQTVTEPVAPHDVAVSPGAVAILVEDNVSLSAQVHDQDGNILSNHDPVWASLDTEVVTVDSTGVVSARRPGVALITATVGSVIGTAQVTVEPRPEIRIAPTRVDLAASEGAGAPLRRVVRITNGGAGTLKDLVARAEYDQPGRQWLSGVLSRTRAPADLTVTVQPAGLPPGRHTGRVLVVSPNGRSVVNVALVVSESPAAILLSASSVQFVATRGRDAPGRKTVEVTNGGGQPLSGLDTQIAFVGTSGWLSASMSSSRAPATLRLQIERTDLAPGQYEATVRVTSPVAPARGVRVVYRVEDDSTTDPEPPPADVPEAPEAPEDLKAKKKGDDGIDLDWKDRSSDESRFEVQRRRPGRPWALIAVVARNKEKYKDRGLEEETRYEYRVRACNAEACSSFSNVAGATTDD